MAGTYYHSLFIASTAASSPPQGPTAFNYQKSSSVALKAAAKRQVFASPVEVGRLSVKDYVEQTEEMIRSADGGPPRWFSPLECRSQLKDSPLLLFLPGVDGVGLGLVLHHQRLGEIFDIWCLHIPIMDRTPFKDLVKLVRATVKSQNIQSPNRPIYLVGESLGGCVALGVAAHSPDIDLVLILSNPATCFNKSQLQHLLPLLEILPSQFQVGLTYMLSLKTGVPLRAAMSTLSNKGLLHLPHGIKAFSSSISLLTDLLRGETLVWKLLMLKSASAYVNRRIHAVKADTLILSSGRDHLLPSKEEGRRLLDILPNCDIRKFSHSGHMLLLQEDGIDLATIIKGANFYRRARSVDYTSDYMPPSPSEFRKLHELHRWLELATSPVLISTLENGKVVRGLEGIPSEGPVLYVANHMLLALDVLTPFTSFWAQRNIHLRGMAHPLWFVRLRDGRLHDLSKKLDIFRTSGIVPVTATNLYKFLSSKSHVLMYPGGVREALHRKGEEYKLFWPEQSQFVRMAATLGAKIVPFGTVGEDDIGQVFLDYNDQMKIPYLKAEIEELNDKLRIGIDGEDANQDLHIPLVAPKIPGRFYYFFGKPIKTEGRELELRNKDKAQELYLEVKSEVERCIAYLLEKRKNDPYRNILPRLFYQATHGFDCKVPTFEL